MNFEVTMTGADKIQKRLDDLEKTFKPNSSEYRQAQRLIAKKYTELTLGAFKKETNPSRKPWKDLQESTQRLKNRDYLGRGKAIEGPTKIGVWTGTLRKSITWRIDGRDILVGSDVEHAKWFHYFIKKGSKKGGPWGDIPARFFLGRSARYDDQVLKVLNQFFKEKFPEMDSVKSAV